MVSSNERNATVSRRVLRGFDPARLTSLRESRGMSRADLARKSGLGGATVQQWESGTRSPQVDTLALVAKTLGLPISELVDVPRDQRFPGDWRVLLGLTQPQLGQQVGISTSMIARIERGEVKLTDENARRLAAALEIGIDELVRSYERARDRPAGVQA
ncbi:XRE family transcriptional regulator [Rhodococcus sp. 15-725-2-2b]|jgi:transcriptional regulator with XRE-family HTH domain|uniref:helix-turn-helix domain-containing protein n=1 Tax=Nocardiaceae TaxID=85025 RepID=UPI00047FC0A7|nr:MULTISPECIES: helix-turn-helix transcriptional regulator [Rhodococcus]MBY4213502.1 helix-turn-helix transcriptional regulator [Rhodococcus fascians]MBY4238408.1 helix-turn-helix transcriptional regulator [Rhodococcus fascians]MBY4254403.1 helix-turn-helix transcriptional regulator [Rhodococcus fascians]MBY4269784.1 helix-turn-helix transcriptional regulator [Rhodococcus fascians]MBY4275604.1 helix-turn-helix transcriptional regulator [Rhodococcus fascians]